MRSPSKRWRTRLKGTAVIGLAILLAIIVACGDDGGGPPPAPGSPGAPKPPPAPAAAAGSGKQLTAQQQIESRVTCPSPQKGSRKCDPAAPKAVVIGKSKDSKDPKADPGLACDEGEYCLQTSDEGYLCGRCPEREQIRHVFKDRDFAPEQNRDPFQSFVVKTLGAGSASDNLQKDPTSRCPRPDQLVATNYGYQDLKLVGIVAQGTQRKVLMMDPALGHIIKRGDCVGKEKAWVKDIGENFVCFEISTEGRPVEARCVELHSKTVATSLPNDIGPPPSARTTTAPIVAPPPVLPTTQRTTAEQPQAPPAPVQAPTNLKP